MRYAYPFQSTTDYTIGWQPPAAPASQVAYAASIESQGHGGEQGELVKGLQVEKAEGLKEACYGCARFREQLPVEKRAKPFSYCSKCITINRMSFLSPSSSSTPFLTHLAWFAYHASRECQVAGYKQGFHKTVCGKALSDALPTPVFRAARQAPSPYAARCQYEFMRTHKPETYYVMHQPSNPTPGVPMKAEIFHALHNPASDQTWEQVHDEILRLIYLPYDQPDRVRQIGQFY
ncbi:hypothetical protein JCM8547_003441 [Rhodosporidiobolus lusitaniae]